MKKILALALCLVLCLGLTACGNGKLVSSDKDTSDASFAVNESSDEANLSDSSQTSEPAGNVGLSDMSTDDFIATIQDQIDELSSGLESSGMGLDVVARGNSLVYSYQYKIDLGDSSLFKDTLESSLNSMSDVFTSVLSSLRLAVPDAESVIVEYLDKNGNIIVSKEFK